MKINKILSILVMMLLTTTVLVSYPTVLADSLDQYNHDIIGFVSMGDDSWYAQSFKPTLGVLTKVKILIALHPDVDTDDHEAYCYIRSSLNGNNLKTSSVNVGSIPILEYDPPSEYTIFDFPDLTVTPNNDYWIVLHTSIPDLYDALKVYVHTEPEDTYPNGEGMYSYDAGDSWEPLGDDSDVWDLCFETYGDTSGGDNPPNCPYDESAMVNGNSVTLECTVSDPDGGYLNDVIFYNGAGKNNQIRHWSIINAETESGTTFSYTWSDLEYDTTYEWHCLAFDGTYETDSESSDCDGELWSFTTESEPEEPNDPPDTPNNPNPEDEAENVDINFRVWPDPTEEYGWDCRFELADDLSWDGGDSDSDTVTYYLYLDKGPNNYDIFPIQVGEYPSSTGTITYDTDDPIAKDNPYFFDWDTTYYWQVKAVDGDGEETKGPEWSFTTEEYVEPPQPEDVTFTPNDFNVLEMVNRYGEYLPAINFRIPIDWNWEMTNWGENIPDDISSNAISTGYGAKFTPSDKAHVALKADYDWGRLGEWIEDQIPIIEDLSWPIPVEFYNEQLMGFYYKVPEIEETEGDDNIHAASVSIKGSFHGEQSIFNCGGTRSYLGIVVDDAVNQNTGIYPQTLVTQCKTVRRHDSGSFNIIELFDYFDVSFDVENQTFSEDINHNTDSFEFTQFEEGEEYIIWVVTGASIITVGGSITVPILDYEIGLNAGYGDCESFFDLDEIKITYHNPPKATNSTQYRPKLETLTCDKDILIQGEEASFTALGTDANDDRVRYQFDWGDGTHSEWTTFVNNGTSQTIKHSWSDTGTYCVRALVMDDSTYFDEDGIEQYHMVTSEIYESEPLRVTVNAPDGSISLSSPSGGFEWKKGLSYDINWNFNGENGDKAIIKLYNNDSSYTYDIAKDIVSAGHYSWSIPSEKEKVESGQPLDIPPGSNYVIGIFTSAGYDFSSPFSIVAPDATVANDDDVTIDEDNSITIDVLSNDDFDHDWVVSIIDVSTPNHGTCQITNGEIKYTPDENYHGDDSFTYEIDVDPPASEQQPIGIYDGSAVVFIEILSVNDDPIANDDRSDVDEGFSDFIDVLDNDADPADGDVILLESFDSTSVKGGTLTCDNCGTPNDKSDDLIFYEPPHSNFCGYDSFTYTISDGNGGTASAEVSITVNNIDNDPPILISISGPTDVKGGEEHTYVFEAYDYDVDDPKGGDRVKLWIDWNEYDWDINSDDKPEEKHNEIPDGEISVSHTWEYHLLKQERRIKARVTDSHGDDVSDWQYLDIGVSKKSKSSEENEESEDEDEKVKSHPLSKIMTLINGRLQSLLQDILSVKKLQTKNLQTGFTQLQLLIYYILSIQ